MKKWPNSVPHFNYQITAGFLHISGIQQWKKKESTSWRIPKTYLKAICILLVTLFFLTAVSKRDLKVVIMWYSTLFQKTGQWNTSFVMLNNIKSETYILWDSELKGCTGDWVDEDDTRKSLSRDIFNTWQKRHRVRCWQSLHRTPSMCRPESITVQEQKCILHGNTLSGLWKLHLVCIFCLFLIAEWRFSIFLGNNPTLINISRSHYIIF